MIQKPEGEILLEMIERETEANSLFGVGAIVLLCACGVYFEEMSAKMRVLHKESIKQKKLN